MKNNNKGFSLMEMVVVISIMIILAGIASLSIATIFNTKAVQCAENLESTLNKVRINTMGRNEVILRVYQDSTNNQFYAEIITYSGIGAARTRTTEEKMVGKSGIKVLYTTDESIVDPTDSGVVEITPGTDMLVSFDRSSGSVKTFQDDSGNTVNPVKTIWITRNDKVKKITLYEETGKIELD